MTGFGPSARSRPVYLEGDDQWKIRADLEQVSVERLPTGDAAKQLGMGVLQMRGVGVSELLLVDTTVQEAPLDSQEWVPSSRPNAGSPPQLLAVRGLCW